MSHRHSQFIDPLYSEPAWHISVLRVNAMKLSAREFLVSNGLFLEAASTSANAMSNKSVLVAIWGHIDMMHELQPVNWIACYRVLLRKCNFERWIDISDMNRQSGAVKLYYNTVKYRMTNNTAHYKGRALFRIAYLLFVSDSYSII